MAGRDIRSFFSPTTAAKSKATTPKVVESASVTTTTTVAVAEADGSISKKREREADANEQDDSAKKQKNDGDGDAGQQDAEDEDAAAAVPLSHGNLIVKARTLMHESWFEQLEAEFGRAYFKNLTRFLQREEAKKQKIYPPPQDVFTALRDCAFSDLKVVIIGQDPYHGPNQAHGLSFSVRRGVPTPPSLRNIYKEAMTDVGITRPTHGCLSSWSEQGVLLLNSVLTVRHTEANSHKKQGWEQFTDAIIRKINSNASHVVFLLWGKPAQEKAEFVDKSKHLVVKSSHPSPLGATKTNAPFIGSKCFSRANAYLKKHDKTPIDWNVPA